MSDEPSTQFLLNRLRDGDDAARRQLVARACERLRRLAGKILHGSFPRLQTVHDLDSVVNQAALQLLTALRDVHPATSGDFFSFVAMQIRRVLLDLARAQTRAEARQVPLAGGDSATADPAFDPGDSSLDPAALACWTEFHTRVQALPADLVAVVDLHWYLGLTQAETAQLLGLPEKTVSRRWLQARLRMTDWLPQGSDVLENP